MVSTTTCVFIPRRVFFGTSSGPSGVPTFLPPKIPAKDLESRCCSRSSPLSVDRGTAHFIIASLCSPHICKMYFCF